MLQFKFDRRNESVRKENKIGKRQKVYGAEKRMKRQRIHPLRLH